MRFVRWTVSASASLCAVRDFTAPSTRQPGGTRWSGCWSARSPRARPSQNRCPHAPEPPPAAHRPSISIAAVATTTANGLDLWVEQEGGGDDVLFISGLADEGACWIDQVAG